MSDRVLRHFLLVFDHEVGKLIEEQEFADTEQALAQYASAEHRFRGRRSIEVVLIGSDSLETVKLTHANYFDGSVTSSRYFSGV